MTLVSFVHEEDHRDNITFTHLVGHKIYIVQRIVYPVVQFYQVPRSTCDSAFLLQHL